jgi:hypothetical protein
MDGYLEWFGGDRRPRMEWETQTILLRTLYHKLERHKERVRRLLRENRQLRYDNMVLTDPYHRVVVLLANPPQSP